MTFDIRPATAHEMGQLGLMGAYSYGGAFGDGPDNQVATGTRPEWTLCAFDNSRPQADGQATMATSFSAFPLYRKSEWPGCGHGWNIHSGHAT